MIRYDTVQCSAMQLNAMQYNAVQYNKIQYNTIYSLISVSFICTLTLSLSHLYTHFLTSNSHICALTLLFQSLTHTTEQVCLGNKSSDIQ
jgi:hypothetical protein